MAPKNRISYVDGPLAWIKYFEDLTMKHWRINRQFKLSLLLFLLRVYLSGPINDLVGREVINRYLAFGLMIIDSYFTLYLLGTLVLLPPWVSTQRCYKIKPRVYAQITLVIHLSLFSFWLNQTLLKRFSWLLLLSYITKLFK